MAIVDRKIAGYVRRQLVSVHMRKRARKSSRSVDRGRVFSLLVARSYRLTSFLFVSSTRNIPDHLPSYVDLPFDEEQNIGITRYDEYAETKLSILLTRRERVFRVRTSYRARVIFPRLLSNYPSD